MIEFPDEFVFNKKGRYDFKYQDDPIALDYIEKFNFLLNRIKTEPIYVKFISGDRKGSIAKTRLDPKYRHGGATIQRRGFSFEPSYYINSNVFQVICYWDGRNNKFKTSMHNEDLIILPNYTGPTIYEMFDHKAAKLAALESPDQYDIDGKKLEIGDNVLYINARYGLGFVLCHGTIVRFEASVDSRKKEIFTIVQRDGTSVTSKILYPYAMIWKK